jgi:amylosucrase
MLQSVAHFEGGARNGGESRNAHVFGFLRHHDGQRLLAMANFSEAPQEVDGNRVRVYRLGYRLTDLVSGANISAEEALRLEPYQCVWLEAHSAGTTIL